MTGKPKFRTFSDLGLSEAVLGYGSVKPDNSKTHKASEDGMPVREFEKLLNVMGYDLMAVRKSDGKIFDYEDLDHENNC